MKKPKNYVPPKKEQCEHENTYPIAFFDEQEFTDWAYIVVECEDCGEKMALVGKQFVSE